MIVQQSLDSMEESLGTEHGRGFDGATILPSAIHLSSTSVSATNTTSIL